KRRTVRMVSFLRFMSLFSSSLGIDLASNHLGIPKLMTAKELADPRTDEHSVMTYISYFRNAQPRKQTLAEQTRAWGKGLVEAYVGEPAPFHVDSPGGKLAV